MCRASWLVRWLKSAHQGTECCSDSDRCSAPHMRRACLNRRVLYKAPYTLSVNLSDFTVCRHTWRKNWINGAVLTGNSAGLRTALSSRISHIELHSSLRESHSFFSLPADTTIALSQGTQPDHPFLTIHSADEHRMIYSFSNTTSYSTFYAFVSSFRITLWLMWLANSKRQPYFYPPQSHAQEDTQSWPQKSGKPDGEAVLCQRTFSSVFCAVFYTVKLHSLT
jgi:hypothetical protein